MPAPETGPAHEEERVHPGFAGRASLPLIRSIIACVCVLAACCLLLTPAAADPHDYFRITVVDAATGRGVPLVELQTTNSVRYYTDSNGIAAIGDPELMGQKVYFHVRSHGYEFPADGFGNRGVAFLVKPGGQGQIHLKRLNIAERLYRITGAGIYRDSVLVGAPVPIKAPLLNGLVMGQDTVEVTPYRDKLYWFFGDTDRPSYPLGLFQTSGATSLLPGRGGLAPDRGVDLTYWVDSNTGFSKAMIPLQPDFDGPIWIAGLFTINADAGRERLITHYSHLDHSGKIAEHGLALFNDDKAIFEKLKVYDLDTPFNIDGHPFRAQIGKETYLYFPSMALESFYLERVRADMADVVDPRSYEAFTCLAPGARYDKENTRLERTPDGRLIWGWKRDTAPLSYDEERQLVAAGKLTPGEALVQLRDIDTGATFRPHGGSTYWNPYLGRWIMLVSEAYGKPSFLGELWFAVADTPVGPWVYARKIVTHDKYTFYNPTQHPFFDQEDGRLIYFEGTYTATFSGNEDRTPRYNYNQIMYRLALDDPRLALPAPVYRLKNDNGGPDYGMRETVAAQNRWNGVQGIPFFAVPPSGRHDGLIPIYLAAASASANSWTLQANAPVGAKPLFYALPPTASSGEKPSPDVAPLYEWRDAQSGERWYAIDASGQPRTATRSAQPLCRVWRNPLSGLPLDVTAQPLRP
jgi:hypothetical protein